MNSLVAYESSGSETDNDECGADGCLGREDDLIVSRESHFQRAVPKAGRSKSTSNWAMESSSPGDLSTGHTAPNKWNVPQINVQTAPKSPDTTLIHQAHPQQGPPVFSKSGLPSLLSRVQKCNKLPAKVISCVQKRSSFQDSVGAPGNIRPYVPKRVRREQAVSYTNSATVDHTEALTSEKQCTASEDQPSNAMSRVSDFIKPYLEKHSKTSEIPKRCLFQMGEHSGPVNKIQWCPVQQHSHLLLSASMDKSLKVWDAIDTSKCLKTYLCHRGAVRDAQWSLCGRQILSGGFDSMLHLTDIETGKQIVSLHNGCRITCLAFNPVHQSSFLTGGFSSTIKAWDTRNCKVVNEYSAAIQQTLDILFLPGGKEFVTSTDVASRDSADRTVIAWDFQTSAKISNQIFHERYTIPCMAVHPKEAVFVAQTNGSYMVLFSTQRPYRMNKRKRYEGHKVEGYAVGCEFSPDGTLIATGSADGTVYFYNYLNSKLIRTLPAHREACVDVSFHPVHPSIIATCDWSGEIKVWH